MVLSTCHNRNCERPIEFDWDKSPPLYCNCCGVHFELSHFSEHRNFVDDTSCCGKCGKTITYRDDCVTIEFCSRCGERVKVNPENISLRDRRDRSKEQIVANAARKSNKASVRASRRTRSKPTIKDADKTMKEFVVCEETVNRSPSPTIHLTAPEIDDVTAVPICGDFIDVTPLKAQEIDDVTSMPICEDLGDAASDDAQSISDVVLVTADDVTKRDDTLSSPQAEENGLSMLVDVAISDSLSENVAEECCTETEEGGVKYLNCRQCSFLCPAESPSQFEKHYKVHIHKCDGCSRVYSSLEKLHNHQVMRHNNPNGQHADMNNLNENLRKSRKMRKMMKFQQGADGVDYNYVGLVHKCDICSKFYTSARALKAHMEKYHGDAETNQYGYVKKSRTRVSSKTPRTKSKRRKTTSAKRSTTQTQRSRSEDVATVPQTAEQSSAINQDQSTDLDGEIDDPKIPLQSGNDVDSMVKSSSQVKGKRSKAQLAKARHRSLNKKAQQINPDKQGLSFITTLEFGAVVYHCTFKGCEYKGNSMLAVVHHLQKNHPCQRFVCTVCDEGFNTKQRAERHYRLAHEIDLESMTVGEGSGSYYQCNQCSKKFVPEVDQNTDERTAKEARVCKKKFIDHMLYHGLQKRFFCQHCNTGFLFERFLRQHIIECRCEPLRKIRMQEAIEKGQRAEIPLPTTKDDKYGFRRTQLLGIIYHHCPLCSVKCRNPYYIKKHMNRVHSGAKVKRGRAASHHLKRTVFECNQCKKWFETKFAYIMHAQQLTCILKTDGTTGKMGCTKRVVEAEILEPQVAELDEETFSSVQPGPIEHVEVNAKPDVAVEKRSLPMEERLLLTEEILLPVETELIDLSDTTTHKSSYVPRIDSPSTSSVQVTSKRKMPDKMKDSGELSHKKTETGADNTEKPPHVESSVISPHEISDDVADTYVDGYDDDYDDDDKSNGMDTSDIQNLNEVPPETCNTEEEVVETTSTADTLPTLDTPVSTTKMVTPPLDPLTDASTQSQHTKPKPSKVVTLFLSKADVLKAQSEKNVTKTVYNPPVSTPSKSERETETIVPPVIKWPKHIIKEEEITLSNKKLKPKPKKRSEVVTPRGRTVPQPSIFSLKNAAPSTSEAAEAVASIITPESSQKKEDSIKLVKNAQEKGYPVVLRGLTSQERKEVEAVISNLPVDELVLESGTEHYHCLVCNFKCEVIPENSSMIAEHKKVHRPPTEGRECPYCHIKLKSGEVLRKHMKSAICEPLQKIAVQMAKQNLDVFGDSLERKKQYPSRYRTEYVGGIRFYLCDQCDYRCKASGPLGTHIKARHTDYQNIKCTECTQAFKSQKSLQNHLAHNNCKEKDAQLRLRKEAHVKTYLHADAIDVDDQVFVIEFGTRIPKSKGLRFRCKHCHKITKENSIMRNHLAVVHGIDIGNYLKNLERPNGRSRQAVNVRCDSCRQVFRGVRALKKHHKETFCGTIEAAISSDESDQE